MEGQSDGLTLQPTKKYRKSRAIFAPWSKEDTTKLIILFEMNPLLWNIALPDYRDVHKKNRVIDGIASDLGKNSEDVKNKWQNLKCQYNGEKRKMDTKSGQGAGEQFSSRWEYFNAMKFTSVDNIQRTNSFSNLDHMSDSNSVTVAISDSGHLSSIPSTSASTSTLTTGRKNRKNQEQTTDRDTLLKTALETMTKSTDSFQIFGDFVADQLRQLTPEKAKKLRLKIQRDILEISDENFQNFSPSEPAV